MTSANPTLLSDCSKDACMRNLQYVTVKAHNSFLSSPFNDSQNSKPHDLMIRGWAQHALQGLWGVGMQSVLPHDSMQVTS